jgi:hypothetical protein
MLIGELPLSTEATVPHCGLMRTIKTTEQDGIVRRSPFVDDFLETSVDLDVPSVCQKPLQTTHRQTAQLLEYMCDLGT